MLPSKRAASISVMPNAVRNPGEWLVVAETSKAPNK